MVPRHVWECPRSQTKVTPPHHHHHPVGLFQRLFTLARPHVCHVGSVVVYLLLLLLWLLLTHTKAKGEGQRGRQRGKDKGKAKAEGQRGRPTGMVPRSNKASMASQVGFGCPA